MAKPERLLKRDTGYYHRVRVPSDLKSHYNRDFIVKSLRTKDPAEAKRLLKIRDGEIEQEFAKLRLQGATAPAVETSPRPNIESAHDLRQVTAAYRRQIEQAELLAGLDLYEQAASDPDAFWRGDLVPLPKSDEYTWFDELCASRDLDQVVAYVVDLRRKTRITSLKRMLKGDLREVIDLACDLVGNVDPRSARVLAIALAKAEIAALEDALSGSLTDLEERAEPVVTPSAPNPSSPVESKASVSLDAVFEKWAIETRPAASTLSTWRGIVKSFKRAYPGKATDINTITPEDMVAWKDALLQQGLSPKTINDSSLACMRRLFVFAIRNRLVSGNPAQDVKVERKKQPGTKMLGYSDEEAKRLLTLARAQTEPSKRWIPWLAATTGSRVGAVAQIWGAAIYEHEGRYVIHIRPAPDAGSIKTEDSERILPLHPVLIADGFLDFVRSRGEGPLFYGRSSGDPTKKHASKSVADRLAKWVRKSGFIDERKAPNHAFRHWFKSSLINAGEDSRVVDRLQGHAAASDAAKYYHANLDRYAEALSKLPLPNIKAD